MATKENINWKRINMGDILPCQSFLRKKDGEILKLSTVGGVKVGQDCYYLPVDEVINVIKDYPVEESKDERIRKAIYNCVKWFGFDSSFFEDVSQEECLDWLENQGEQKYTEWSEEDEWCLEQINFLIRNSYSADDKVERLSNWLKFLKERVQHQSTWKPSKGQMKALNTCIMQGEISYIGQGTELQSLYNDLKKLTE